MHTQQRQQILTTVAIIIFSTCLFGIFSSWGFISPYLASYLRIYNPDIKISQVNWCILVVFIGEGLAVLIFEKLRTVLGMKQTFRFALILYGVMNILCAFSKNVYQTISLFLSMGISYNLVLMVASFLIMKLLPDKPGQSTFLGTLGVSCSPICIGYLIQYIVNPDNKDAVIQIQEGEKIIKYFDEEIASRLPTFFQVVAGYTILAGVIGPYFMPEYSYTENGVNSDGEKSDFKKEDQELETIGQKNSRNENDKEDKLLELENGDNGQTQKLENDEERLKELASKEFRSAKFWSYYITIVLGIAFAQLFQNYFKVFCLLYYDDRTATYFSTISTFTMILARFIFGYTQDNYGYLRYVDIHFSLKVIGILLLWKFHTNLFFFYSAYVIFYGLYGSQHILYYSAGTKIWGRGLAIKLFAVSGYTTTVAVIVIYMLDVLFTIFGYESTYFIIIIGCIANIGVTHLLGFK